MKKKKQLIVLSTILIFCLLGAQLMPVSARDNVLDSVTKVYSGYPSRVANEVLILKVVDNEFTVSDGVAVEIESMDYVLDARYVRFDHDSRRSIEFWIEDLSPIGSGDKITFIIQGSDAYRLPGASIRGRVGMKYDYSVSYHKDSENSAPFKTESGKAKTGIVIPYDIENNVPEGYTSSHAISGQQIVGPVNENNILHVVYTTKRADLSYKVVYLGPDGKDIRPAITVNNVTFAQSYTVAAPAITGYKADAASKSISITTGTNQITFNYAIDQTYKFAYTVRYYKDSTSGSLIKTERGSAVMNSIIPYNAEANKPDGYTSANTTSGQKTVTVTPASNVLNVVYTTKRTDLSYRVVYLDPDGKDIRPAVTVNNVTFAQSYTVAAPAITGYKADAASKSISITTGTNQITFNYTADKAQAKSVTMVTAVNKEYLVPVSYQDVKTKDFTLKLTYDRSKLQLLDITAQTHTANLSSDPESTARFEIISNSNGVVTFKVKQGMGSNEMGSGDATIVKFKGLASGSTTVTVEAL